jgi:ankyrin repeat protein
MGTLDEHAHKLAEVLASTSGVLFPAKMGRKRVRVNSVGCSNDTPLHVMAWREDSEAIKLLVDAGANVNAIGDMSETPLHVAVKKGSLEIVETLLAAGARTDLRSEFGKTAADSAHEKGGDIETIFKRYQS